MPFYSLIDKLTSRRVRRSYRPDKDNSGWQRAFCFNENACNTFSVLLAVRRFKVQQLDVVTAIDHANTESCCHDAIVFG